MPRTSKEQSDSKFDADLDEWWVVVDTATFDASLEEVRLVGRIYRDRLARFPDGGRIITTTIRRAADRIVPGAIVRTRNTRYRLLSAGEATNSPD